MRVTFVLNRVGDLKPDQTTTALAVACAARGIDTGLVGADDLGIRPDGSVIACRAVVPNVSAAELAARAATLPRATAVWGTDDRVFVRVNPGREARTWVLPTMLDLLDMARRGGTLVRNDPRALQRARSKLFLHLLPESIRPRTLVSRDPSELRAFVAENEGGTVLKPLDGTQGRDVFRIRAGQRDNLGQIVDLLTRSGFCMAQSFVPEAMSGDVRLILVNGELLRVNGRTAAVRRVPSGDDFRSNVHVGGRPQLEEPSESLREVARLAGEALVEQGIFLCGLDVIGHHVVEANVFAPGGLTDAGRFAGVDFTGALLDAFLAE
jgi:glutathione synthase